MEGQEVYLSQVFSHVLGWVTLRRGGGWALLDFLASGVYMEGRGAAKAGGAGRRQDRMKVVFHPEQVCFQEPAFEDILSQLDIAAGPVSRYIVPP